MPVGARVAISHHGVLSKVVVTIGKVRENPPREVEGLRGCQVGLSGPAWHYCRAVARGIRGSRPTADPVGLAYRKNWPSAVFRTSASFTPAKGAAFAGCARGYRLRCRPRGPGKKARLSPAAPGESDKTRGVKQVTAAGPKRTGRSCRRATACYLLKVGRAGAGTARQASSPTPAKRTRALCPMRISWIPVAAPVEMT